MGLLISFRQLSSCATGLSCSKGRPPSRALRSCVPSSDLPEQFFKIFLPVQTVAVDWMPVRFELPRTVPVAKRVLGYAQDTGRLPDGHILSQSVERVVVLS